jgi:TolB protein
MNKRSGLNAKFFIPLLIFLVIANASLVLLFVWPGPFASGQSPLPEITEPATLTLQNTSTELPASTSIPTQTAPPTPTLPPTAALEALKQQGVIFLSMSDGANFHLFAYHPQYYQLTRLTSTPWDDIDPVVSPDGTKIAYSSRQNGYWDVFLYDLTSGKSTRLTDTPDYEAPSSWSPDGQWLAIERLLANRLQIFLLPMADKSAAPEQLTAFDAPSYDPQWSSKGREVAFVSSKDGKEDIWLARLDKIDDRFINLTGAYPGNHRQPRWSPDGSLLAWSAEQSDGMAIQILDSQGGKIPQTLGPGINPVWSPAGNAILAEVRGANSTSLTAYKTTDGELLFPLTRLPGSLNGWDWRSGPAVELVTRLPLPASARQPAAPLWQKKISAATPAPLGRDTLVQLTEVAVPYPYLDDAVDEAFVRLRAMTGKVAGWDFLASLENAFVPLTVAAPPGTDENWLNTGRAIAVNSVPLNAAWMVTLREDIAGQTYWRVFLRARYQDGSQGIPLTEIVWDLNARNSGSPTAYDQGGEYSTVPEGYWIDFTELAERFGWERLPAQVNWRTFYQASRFNLFVLRENFNFQSAMAQLYPIEALATPTALITLTTTPTPTRTPWFFKYITPSLTPTLTLTATLRPTLTPPAINSTP